MAHPSNGTEHRKAVIGNEKNFWLWSSRDGFDLTHPSTPSSPPIKNRLTFSTTASPIAIDPAKSALVIIDMQNFFLSPAFGRNVDGAGHKALNQLTINAIPAARKAGIRVLWVNWGLTQKEVDDMPPSTKRAFGFEAVPEDEVDDFKLKDTGIGVDRQGTPRPQNTGTVLDSGKDAKVYKGLGCDCGTIIDPETGKEIAAGRLLMRDQWNSALCPPLDKAYEEGLKLDNLPDVWIHKNRMSGLWGPTTELEQYLEQEGIKTLLFTGVNTDQCVGGTLQDAFSKGYDCILLADGAGTTSPEHAQQCIEFNCGRSWGFVASCKQFAQGVESSFVM